MPKSCFWSAWAAACFFSVNMARTAEPSPAAKAALNDAQALAARIDHHLSAGWKTANVEAVPLAGDAEFLRRAYLDLAGRIPTVAEARAFQGESQGRLGRRRRL